MSFARGANSCGFVPVEAYRRAGGADVCVCVYVCVCVVCVCFCSAGVSCAWVANVCGLGTL